MPPPNGVVCASGPCKYCSCKKVWYCGEVCQKGDWNRHKGQCPFRGWKTSLLDKPDPIFADLPYGIDFTRRLFRNAGAHYRGSGAILDFDASGAQAPNASADANHSGASGAAG